MNTLDSLFDWTLAAGLRASLLVLAVLAAQWFMKKRLPSRWRYALWLPVLVALLVPALPVLPSWMNWPAATVIVSESGALSAAVPGPPTAHAVERMETLTPPPALGQVEAPARTPAVPRTTTPVSVAAGPVNWRAWLLPAWLIGATGASLFVLASFGLTMWRIRRQLHSVETELLARITRIAQSVGLRGAPRILQSAAVASPAVCGVWRPTLLLNEGFPKHLSDDESDMVLRHELMHIRRGDLIVNALLCALLALHWFNPLLWLAFLRVRADREAACDAQVLDGEPPQRRAAYGHTLLKMETEFPPTGLCLGFVGILQRGGTLRERIHAIIAQPKPNITMKTFTALSIIALAIAGIAKAAEKEPEPKMEKVSIAEFRKQYANSKIEHSVYQITYLGHKDGKASIRVRSLPDASSLLPDQGRWSERIIYVHLQDLDPEFRAELEKAAASLKANDPDVLKGSGYPLQATQAKPGKSGPQALFDPIVRKFLAEVGPDYNKDGGFWNNAEFIKKDSEFSVAELEIDGLWETLGVQVFQLDCSPHERSEVFFHGDGGLRYQPLMDNRGPANAVLSDGSLYFTHESGSGIGITSLVKVGRDKDNVLQSESLGVIASRPDGHEDKELVKRMADVIAKLRPVKLAAATKPAPAPKAEPEPKRGAKGAQGPPVDLNTIKDKISVRSDADTVASLRRDGDRLLPRAPGEKGEANDVAVKISIKETTDTPFPVQGDPTRSYLEMSHGFDKPLHFRALARLKGGKEFYEVEGPLEPVEPGDMSLVRCWESGTLLEEVILYEFKPTPEATGETGRLTTPPDAAAKEGEARTAAHPVDGSQTGRVAAVTKQLSKAGKLPGPLLDAQCIEEQTGDGILGPSDFAAFYALTVAPADLPAWRAALSDPKATWNHFSNDAAIRRAAPKKAQTWWVKEAGLSALEFYSPQTLTGRSNGWVGIAPDGRIFIYAFTM